MTKGDFSNTAYHQHLSAHKLMGNRCQECGKIHLPPRPMCPKCYSDDLVWVEAPEKGELTGFTVIHIAPTAMLDAGYGRENPYVSGIVRLENGLSISAQILGVDPTKPDEIKIGIPLRAEFIERGEGEDKKTFLAFRAL
jgi:uncharacterized OB-fold protein